MLCAAVAACARREAPAPPAPRPSILLVTLDTTRADAIGPEAKGVETPAFNALAQRARRFRYAYATAPQTLPSHASMLTGLYPAGHGVRENGRALAPSQRLVAEQLRGAGYRTAAFLSSFVLARRFGLARGFEVYDDDLGRGREERSARETTDRALAWLATAPSEPLFVWVHYYDPHYPYAPSYHAEIAAMDEHLGRLVSAFERRANGAVAVIVAADHGEGLGDHGEPQHGDLLYQSTMHVPLLIAGPGVSASVAEDPVSARRIAHTILDWAGIDATGSLRRPLREVVAGEAMKPFLDYGWQPQVMAVDGNTKAILAGRVEVYDVAADPGESRDLAATAALSRDARATLREYPLPSQAETGPENLDEESRRKLASLGYVASTVQPVIRAGAPRPADMAHLFGVLEEAALLFAAAEYTRAVPLLRRILESDPHNLEAALRLAVAYSSLGQDAQALAAFRRAQAIAPQSRDVLTYLALHLARTPQWQEAVPLLERIITEEPDRLPPLEALAVIREREGRVAAAIELRKRIYALRSPTAAELRQLGRLQMAAGQTADAIGTFERLRSLDPAAFNDHLELGVLYLAARRYADARASFDRVPSSHPDYAMALFKRAQVSVLLREPDAASRIEAARREATPLTRQLIARERLFTAQ